MFLAPLLAAGGGGGGFTDLDTGLFWWTLVMFAIFAGLLHRFAWGPLLKVIAEREQGIRNAVDEARKSKEEAESLLEQHKTLLRESGREREEILKKAQADADKIKQELTDKARTEADNILTRAKAQIDHEKSQAIQELRSQVADIAITAASKIVRSSLTPDEQRKIVDEFIAELPKAH